MVNPNHENGHSVHYYRSWALTHDNEITPDEARTAPHYIVCHRAADATDRVEIIDHGKVIEVHYHDRTWPDERLLSKHRTTFGDVPFKVLTPVTGTSPARQRVYRIDAQGTVQGFEDLELDSAGELLAQDRFSADGRLLERIEHEYNENGDLTLSREIAPDGTILSELRTDDP